MDTKTKKFIIEIISKINDDSSIIIEHLGENYFIEQHKKTT